VCEYPNLNNQRSSGYHGGRIIASVGKPKYQVRKNDFSPMKAPPLATIDPPQSSAAIKARHLCTTASLIANQNGPQKFMWSRSSLLITLYFHEKIWPIPLGAGYLGRLKSTWFSLIHLLAPMSLHQDPDIWDSGYIELYIPAFASLFRVEKLVTQPFTSRVSTQCR